MSAQKSVGPIQLTVCHLRDAARYRLLADGAPPARPIKAWRSVLAELARTQTDVYIIGRGGEDIGYLHVLYPFRSECWGMACLSTVAREGDAIAREVSRQLFEKQDNLYRVDMYICESPLSSSQSEDLSTAHQGREHGLFSLTDQVMRLTFYSPEVSRRQVMFMSWPYGYLAFMTNPERDKIETIQFVRGKAEHLVEPVRKAAALLGLIGSDGLIVEGRVIVPGAGEPAILSKTREEITRYLNAERDPVIDYVPPYGTPFQKRVWEETARIPFGSVKTYAEIARLIEPDQRKAGRLARAVGQALSANPLPILIPCHRVIGSNRDLTGFAGGIDVKEYLLQMEMWKLLSSS